MNRLAVDDVRGAAGLAALRVEWEELFESVPRASPFLSPEWALTWQELLAEGSVPRVLCARRDGRLVGVLALSEREHWAGLGRPVKRLAFLAEQNVGADGLDVLALPGFERDAASAMLARLAADSSVDVLDLEGLPGESPTLQLLAWNFGNDRRRSYTLAPSQVCPYLDLGGSWEEMLGRTKRPQQFARLLRELGRRDGFEVRSVTEPGMVGGALDRLFQLHDRRWAFQGGSDAFARQSVREFHRRFVERIAARRMVRFEELWVEGACRASWYGFGRADRYWAYQSGYDPAWSKHSVAFVRLGISVQEAAGRGVRFYDFLRGPETYKFDWASGARVTMRVVAVRSRRAARFLMRRRGLRLATEQAAEAVLSERSLEWMRRLRRARHRRQPFTLSLPHKRGPSSPEWA